MQRCPVSSLDVHPSPYVSPDRDGRADYGAGAWRAFTKNAWEAVEDDGEKVELEEEGDLFSRVN